jgi:hypothetical protein
MLFCFEMVLDLQKSCKNKKESSSLALSTPIVACYITMLYFSKLRKWHGKIIINPIPFFIWISVIFSINVFFLIQGPEQAQVSLTLFWQTLKHNVRNYVTLSDAQFCDLR